MSRLQLRSPGGGHQTHRARRPLHLLLPGAAALAALLFVGWIAIAQAETTFVPGFEDLPLMPGLTPVSDTPVLFDAPSGRIVEAQASGSASPARILDFYRETLPQLGWQARAADGSFEREGEVLKLTVTGADAGQVSVRFTLAPAPR